MVKLQIQGGLSAELNDLSEQERRLDWDVGDARLEAFKLRWSLPGQVRLNDRQAAEKGPTKTDQSVVMGFEKVRKESVLE